MINVYWTCLEKEFVRADEPVNIYKSHLKNKPADLYNPHNFINQCPAIHDALMNVYGIKSIYDYEMKYENKQLESKVLDQDFYNSHVQVRSMDQKFFSFVQKVIFFTDETSLQMTAYEPAFLEDNSITRATYSIPGKYDIGKWFRPLEFNFYLKENVSTFKIKEGDIYTYIRFHTDEKINFIRYMPTDTIKKYSEDVVNSVFNKRAYRTLDKYYINFKNSNMKKTIMKEIKDNLC